MNDNYPVIFNRQKVVNKSNNGYIPKIQHILNDNLRVKIQLFFGRGDLYSNLHEVKNKR